MENSSRDIKDITFYIKDRNLSFSYRKTKKLITALFMVTDIMDKDEPIRAKLRSLGIDIISDSYSLSSRTDYTSLGLLNKISQALSFLDIASDIQLISEMNNNILKKEFLIFKKSIEDSVRNTNIIREDSLLELFKEEEIPLNKDGDKEFNTNENVSQYYKDFSKGHIGQDKVQKNYKGQSIGKIGVQKGSTLLKALKDIENMTGHVKHNINKIDISNDDRKKEIINILRDHKEGLTITEIKNFSKGQISNMSEKTLQRELVYLVSENMIQKTGLKRWSRYFIKST